MLSPLWPVLQIGDIAAVALDVAAPRRVGQRRVEALDGEHLDDVGAVDLGPVFGRLGLPAGVAGGQRRGEELPHDVDVLGGRDRPGDARKGVAVEQVARDLADDGLVGGDRGGERGQRRTRLEDLGEPVDAGARLGLERRPRRPCPRAPAPWCRLCRRSRGRGRRAPCRSSPRSRRATAGSAAASRATPFFF